MNVTTKDRAVKTSAWVLYTLIVLEILFMVSPFAAYYYSIYATPLNALQASPFTAWLTMYVLPHFTYTESWLANGLVMLAWPLMLLGIVVFVFGFCQIYWAKFTRKGAVEVGLYKYIRHPQYGALAVIGLGACLYWSRFVVIVAFVSMLCLYYFLARTEERICLEKFGESYRSYLRRTGMFLPRSWEARWRGLDWRLPEARWKRVVTVAGLYLAVVVVTTGAAFLLRNHVIDSLQTDVLEDKVIVYLGPVSAETRATVSLMLDDGALDGDLAYVAPSSWKVPELGLERTSEPPPGAGHSELLHPTTHGNSLLFDQGQLNVVTVEAAYIGGNKRGMDRFTRALNLRPLEFARLDLSTRKIVETRQATDSQWAGIPVPTF